MYDRLLDKSIQPSAEELAAYCGENGARFNKLNAMLSAEYNTVTEIRFPYGKSYGWCITHRKGKKLICDIFAEAGAFNVMLRLSDKQFSEAYDELSAYTQEHIDNRYPCGDGGWIHLRVLNDEHLKDVESLLYIKCR